MRTIYNLLLTVWIIVLAPFYLFRLWRRGEWREGFFERFGRYSARTKQALTNRRIVWIHGVSVGEANLAVLLVRALEPRLPHLKMVVSTTTNTGMHELRRRLPVGVEKVYYPVDRRPWVRRAFAVLRPELVILVEAELWPNFLWHARRRRVPIVLANARISDRSFGRYRGAGFLFRDLFGGLAGVGAQNANDARRLVDLGCQPEVVQVTGSLKFEPAPPGNASALDVPRLLAQAGMPPGARILLGASTHDGEEALLADLFRRLRKKHPDLYLVLVPRHQERSRSIGGQLDRAGIRYLYRSEVSFAAPPQPGSSDCLVVNSTGELRHFYPHVELVFIGKSLVGRGGQNPIEPAAAGRAIVFGPHMNNFRDIVARFLEADAVEQVANEKELERTLDELLSNHARREQLGRHAMAVVDASRGALERTVGIVLRVLEEKGLYTPPPNPDTPGQPA